MPWAATLHSRPDDTRVTAWRGEAHPRRAHRYTHTHTPDAPFITVVTHVYSIPYSHKKSQPVSLGRLGPARDGRWGQGGTTAAKGEGRDGGGGQCGDDSMIRLCRQQPLLCAFPGELRGVLSVAGGETAKQIKCVCLCGSAKTATRLERDFSRVFGDR